MVEAHEIDIIESDLGEFGTFNGEERCPSRLHNGRRRQRIKQTKRGGSQEVVCTTSKTLPLETSRKYLGVIQLG